MHKIQLFFLIIIFTGSCMEKPMPIDIDSLNRPPTASFTVFPSSGKTSIYFQFDASGSSDNQDESSSLQVRWDWESDGIWDTDYSTTKTTTHQYPTAGTKTVKLELRDVGGLTNSTTRQLTVELETGTVTDIDGNVYQTIKIGNQWWMAENLKVTHYRNGETIPNVIYITEWSNLSTGACCNYNNNANNTAIYGRLYNWYAVDDSLNIAPEGWHVPTDSEWQTLVGYLGGSSVAGGKMKETGTTHWAIPNTGATNESGFSALPGGARYGDGGFSHIIGEFAIFWSATESSSGSAWDRSLGYSGSGVYRGSHFNKRSGFSVRCVRD